MSFEKFKLISKTIDQKDISVRYFYLNNFNYSDKKIRKSIPVNSNFYKSFLFFESLYFNKKVDDSLFNHVVSESNIYYFSNTIDYFFVKKIVKSNIDEYKEIFELIEFLYDENDKSKFKTNKLEILVKNAEMHLLDLHNDQKLKLMENLKLFVITQKVPSTHIFHSLIDKLESLYFDNKYQVDMDLKIHGNPEQNDYVKVSKDQLTDFLNWLNEPVKRSSHFTGNGQQLKSKSKSRSSSRSRSNSSSRSASKTKKSNFASTKKTKKNVFDGIYRRKDFLENTLLGRYVYHHIHLLPINSVNSQNAYLLEDYLEKTFASKLLFLKINVIDETHQIEEIKKKLIDFFDHHFQDFIYLRLSKSNKAVQNALNTMRKFGIKIPFVSSIKSKCIRFLKEKFNSAFLKELCNPIKFEQVLKQIFGKQNQNLVYVVLILIFYFINEFFLKNYKKVKKIALLFPYQNASELKETIFKYNDEKILDFLKHFVHGFILKQMQFLESVENNLFHELEKYRNKSFDVVDELSYLLNRQLIPKNSMLHQAISGDVYARIFITCNYDIDFVRQLFTRFSRSKSQIEKLSSNDVLTAKSKIHHRIQKHIDVFLFKNKNFNISFDLNLL